VERSLVERRVVRVGHEPTRLAQHGQAGQRRPGRREQVKVRVKARARVRARDRVRVRVRAS
jgi:hypothetical protein